ncbi:uncharacterized protein MONOS_14135 [Monocercomonoides exilis]|uniref:uncharacterized protein n=1 Tax=Monocercomonoides exilis TaxID=2049356 RepID=UPI00355A7B7B|nr:hypothetical protein MONOS_14135 [Monocercomonoides exilis]|eukprot:MONOS_14135.1-p1 / transcript=MONOS_14135.1 / gene=MONOS_14135 / organism=Monocercomonoides_exilis_PA203 / gene_product=unspecified product / transcript_product=unspecified product / location=Mono_scaffold00944:10755-11401(-) / protein_length=197 / sequence_SO=supercontig / SO=protein_coding / is_pseudo=false
MLLNFEKNIGLMKGIQNTSTIWYYCMMCIRAQHLSLSSSEWIPVPTFLMERKPPDICRRTQSPQRKEPFSTAKSQEHQASSTQSQPSTSITTTSTTPPPISKNLFQLNNLTAEINPPKSSFQTDRKMILKTELSSSQLTMPIPLLFSNGENSTSTDEEIKEAKAAKAAKAAKTRKARNVTIETTEQFPSSELSQAT